MIRTALLAAFLIAAATPAAFADDATCPAPTATTNPQPITITAPKAALAVRVANTYATREYGLMCITSLAPHTGMVFVFSDGDLRRSFWMKNTLIPLDMVFVRKNGRVDTVAANVPSTTPATTDLDIPWRYGIGTYVIELAAGEAARDGIVRGAHLDVSRVGPSKD
jgi:uncharacterized membrane protein (UPF0127 family)